ncbi:MAG TPA: Fic family protein [Syntrophales bacterium]|nr:Fic family protein [Syntrophales bacterium]
MTTERTYLKTHPWLTFKLNFQPIRYDTWIQLGEAQSKCEHISGIPIQPETAKKLYNIYLAKGVLATTAIEGNTLSEEDTLRRIEGTLKLPPSQEYLGKEIDNIVKACNIMKQRILDGCSTEVDVNEIKEFNKLILDGLELNEGVVPGEIRKHSVGVGPYRGAPAEDCEYLLNRYVDWLNKELVPFDGNVTAFNIIKAIAAHVYFTWIHPFGDGNGRTARLIELKILMSAGVPIPATQLLTNHYNLTRQEYYRHLDISSKNGGDLIPFIKYAIQGYVDGLREQLGKIRQQQFKVTWENYVHEHFKDQDTPTDIRRRHLVLDLSRQNNNAAVPIAKISEISHRITIHYVGKTKKTVMRDINFLEKAQLITKTGRGMVRAKTEVIEAFLSPCRKD